MDQTKISTEIDFSLISFRQFSATSRVVEMYVGRIPKTERDVSRHFSSVIILLFSRNQRFAAVYCTRVHFIVIYTPK